MFNENWNDGKEQQKKVVILKATHVVFVHPNFFLVCFHIIRHQHHYCLDLLEISLSVDNLLSLSLCAGCIFSIIPSFYSNTPSSKISKIPFINNI